MDTQDKVSFFVGDWQVSPLEGVVSRDGKSVRLEPKAIEVLAYLASRPGEVVSRDDLEKAVWRGAIVGYDAVTSTVIKLRKALGDSAREPQFIATVPKRGYQLIAPVTHRPSEDVPSAAASGIIVPEMKTTGPGLPARRRPALVFLVPALVAGLLFLFFQGAQPPGGETSTIAPQQDSRAPPSIIVLPFEDMSEQPQNDRFADGITEDIITDLSGVSNLLVIASNTSFTFKGRRIAASDLALELEVDFVLQGSIRRDGNSLRVNAQLVDARSGFQKWANRYDHEIAEVFAVQDEVTRSIVEALAIKLSLQEAQRLAHRPTSSIAAYDYFQEGQRLAHTSTRESNLQAQVAYRKAIEADPDYGRAFGALGYTLAYAYRRGWTDAPVQTIDRALDLAKTAVELDSSTPQTYWALGYVHLMRKEYELAEAAVSQGLSIAPNYADGYGLLALIKNALGESQTAIGLIEKGMRLNPYYTWDYPYNLGRAYYALGRIDAAITALEDARNRNGGALPVRLHLAASYVQADRLGDAEWEVQEILALNPAETISLLQLTHPIRDPEGMRAFVADLRAAGLPE